MPITKIRNNYGNLLCNWSNYCYWIRHNALIVTERENKKKVVKDELQPGMVAALGLMPWFLL